MESIDDSVIVGKVLRSLILRYEYVVCSIIKSYNLDELALDDMESSLKVYKQRMNKKIGAEQALYATTNNKSSALRS